MSQEEKFLQTSVLLGKDDIFQVPRKLHDQIK